MSYENESARIWDDMNDTREEDYYKNKAWDAYDEMCEYYGSERELMIHHISQDIDFDDFDIHNESEWTEKQIETIKDEIYTDLLKQAMDFDDYE